MHVIGITGKIGCGKSTVAVWLEKCGAVRIDCDDIVHALYEPGQPGTVKIRAFFEGAYLKKDGSVNREKLRRTLFKHPKKWEILNRMIHPLVAEELRRRFKKVKGGVVALEIPIYTDRWFREFVDELWWIECSETVQAKRLAQRGLTMDQIRVFNKQHAGERPPYTTVVENNGSIKGLETVLKALYNKKDE